MALKLKGSTSGFVAIDAPSVAGNNTLILPENSGSAFQLFANDITAGVTTFTSVSVNRNGDLTVPGTISIGGTLTYEDVTSVDSVGIVTARGLSIFGNTTGLRVTGVGTFVNNLSVGGQIGVGVDPDTWSTGNSITLGTAQATLWGVSDQVNLSGNAYYNSGWKAAATKAGASQIQQALGDIDFKVSGSVTADLSLIHI